MRNKGQEKRFMFYKEIIKVLSPIFKKYGKENVRRAVQKWNSIELQRNKLLKEKKEIEKRLVEL